jgi:hypothetical protein
VALAAELPRNHAVSLFDRPLALPADPEVSECDEAPDSSFEADESDFFAAGLW